jgi:hypothetical protein
MVQLVDYATEEQMARLFRGFYPELEADSPMPIQFAADVWRSGLDVSMAELQGHLLRHKGEPLEALVNVEDLAAEALARTETSKWNNKSGDAAEGAAETVSEQMGRPARRLHGSEADRVVFNPQEGWEDSIGKVVRK